MNKKFCYRLFVGLLVVLLIGSLCACSEDDDRGKVVFTAGLGKEELFRIDEVSCTLPEYMLYLTNTKNRYEDVFGSKIWEVTYEGTSFEDNMKDILLAKIAQMKSVYLLAQEKGVELTEAESRKLEQAADAYFSSLSEEEISQLKVTKEMVLQLYTEYTLADKVYQQIISQVNPEISDDEARAVTVEQIVMKKQTTDGRGNVIVYTEKAQAEALAKMEEIREMVLAGERDFTEMVGKYNEAEDGQITFQKGEMDKAIEEAAFQLQTDEISSVIETNQGYYLLKCINTFDREQTDANKLVLIENRKNQAFGQEYDAFVKKLARKLNDDLWEEIELTESTVVKTNSFFDVYEEYFPAK